MYLMDRISFELYVAPETMVVENLYNYIEKFGEPNYNDLISHYGSKEKIEKILLECVESSNSLELVLKSNDVEYSY
ncbi:MAG: hypothetical protein ACRCU6_01795 [Fusobacteriaceae bacterium]